MIVPEEPSPQKQELLALARRLFLEDLRRFVIQVGALAERYERRCYEWIENDDRG
jgi:hypothetical protein